MVKRRRCDRPHQLRGCPSNPGPSNGETGRDEGGPMPERQRRIVSYLMDMDGVIVHEENLIPGADRFVNRLQETGHRFLILTNNSIYTPRDLAARLAESGLQVPATAIWTSALATAQFLASQRPGGSAFVIGEAGLTTALHESG